MFVRLFVDENLDRMVPISKQPKEKIQAIIESCSRQFPEFQERARKRIRTYLKSCRRMKKNGMELVSPQHPPPPSPLQYLWKQTLWPLVHRGAQTPALPRPPLCQGSLHPNSGSIPASVFRPDPHLPT